MNLGSLLTNLNSSSNNGILGNNKTLLIFAIIVFIIFGFGYGLNGVGGNYGQGAQEHYDEFAEYGHGNPAAGRNPANTGYPEEPRKRKKKHKHSRDDDNEYDGENLPPRNMRPGMDAPPYGMPFPNMMPPDNSGLQEIPFS